MRAASGTPLALLAALLAAGLGGCVATPRDPSPWLPLGDADPALLDGVPTAELEQLALISTNLVSALLQLPEVSPANATLQLSPPSTAFGSIVVRALEEAGYGVQRVDADQGNRYVAYRRNYAETEAGPITEYELLVGNVSLKREYVSEAGGVFPSSLLTVEGSAVGAADITLDDAPFREQGGVDVAFISGVRAGDGAASVGEMAVNDFDRQPRARRTPQRAVLEAASRRAALAAAEGDAASALDGLERLRRTVLIFENAETLRMGAGNKQAVRLLVRDTRPGDRFVVTACTDADGRDEAARSRGARVVEEFLGHGLEPETVRLAPCMRASYRHASDDSPVPVEIVQYRRRGGDGRP